MNERRRVGIVGSRSGIELAFVDDFVRSLDPAELTIVSGGARGVDRAAVEAAKRRGIPVAEHLPNWDIDKLAGKRRNWRLVNDCDDVVAFWDGYSNGTAHAVAAAVRMGKRAVVYSPEIVIQQAMEEARGG